MCSSDLKFLIQLDAFPMTVNGKIDSKALPIPDFKTDIPFVEPRNDFEKDISNILCNLLNLDKISIDENFFDIGCDSIIAIRFQLEALKLVDRFTKNKYYFIPTRYYPLPHFQDGTATSTSLAASILNLSMASRASGTLIRLFFLRSEERRVGKECGS